MSNEPNDGEDTLDVTDLAQIAEAEESIQRSLLPSQRTALLSLDQLAIQDPGRVTAILTARAEGLKTIRRLAFEATKPEDWVLFKAKNGSIRAMLKKSGAEQVRKTYVVQAVPAPLYDTHGRVVGRSDVVVEMTSTADGKPKMVASLSGDAISMVTGEIAFGIRGIRSSTEDFVGRGQFDREMAKQDLEESARTAFLTKATRVLGGMSSVILDELETLTKWGLNQAQIIARCEKGRGFGSAKDREAMSGGAQSGAASSAPTPASDAERLINQAEGNRFMATVKARAVEVACGDDEILRGALLGAGLFVPSDTPAINALAKLGASKLADAVAYVKAYDPKAEAEKRASEEASAEKGADQQ